MKPASVSTVITCHSNADWDALSSMIGMTMLYPDSVMIFPGSMEKTLNSFFSESVSSLYLFRTPKEIDPSGVRRVVVVDTQLRSRVPQVHEFLDLPGVEVEVWDHHPIPEEDQDNPGRRIRADVEHIGTTGSTCTLICEELQRRGHVPACQEATLLGLGIYGDTGAFTYSSTRPEDFMAAAWLRRYGMDLPQIAELVHTGMTSNHIRVLNALLESAAVHEIGSSTVVLADVSLDGFLDDFAYMVQKFMEMESCSVLFALAAMGDKVQVIARSRVDAIDVGIICKHLGGGGHRFAASASVKNRPIPELKDVIFQQIYAQVHPDKRARDLMSSPPVGIEEHLPIREAENIMNRYGLKAAPVFRSGTRHCIGYMECQTAARAVAHELGDVPTAEYMQRTVLTVPPDAPLQKLMQIIVGAHQRLVPVVEKNDVVGVVTRTDLINMFVDDPAGMPIPRNTSTRERNLAKLLTTRLPASMLDIMRRAGRLGDKKGINVYAVGGFVRDIMLSRPASEYDDVDLVVESDGILFARELAAQLGGRIREHRAFMTALIIYTDADGTERRLDVATARLEYYRYPAALPTVELSSIKMDLFRRDFTINAMALRLNTGQFGNVVDFFGGQNDIQRKTIRVIHALSFVEDPTRIIRAVRFEQRYGFHISLQGEKLIRNALALHLVEKLSGARILHELKLIFREDDPLSCLKRLDGLGVLKAIHPALSLNAEKTELLEALAGVIDWYSLLYFRETPDLSTLYLLALCSAVPQHETEDSFQRLGLNMSLRGDLLKLRETVRTTIQSLVDWHRDGKGRISRLHALLSPLPLEGLLYLMARVPEKSLSRFVSQYIYKWRQVKADVTGEDLMQLGLAPGPSFGSIMRKVLAAKLDEEAVTREEQLELARRLVRRVNRSAEPSQI